MGRLQTPPSRPGRAPLAPSPEMLLLLLLAQLWAGSLAQKPQKAQMVELVEVQEGLCGLVVCSFKAPKASQNNSTTHQYWYRRNQNDPGRVRGNEHPLSSQRLKGPKETQTTHNRQNQSNILVATSDPGAQNQIRVKSSLRLLGDPLTHNCTLGIFEPQRQESGIYYLQLNKNENLGPKTPLLALHVTALTQTPSIHMDNPLQSGHPNTLRCSLPGACLEGSLTFSWHGEALRPLGLVLNSSEIQLSPQAQDHGTQLTCRVTVQGANVSTEKTVVLNVSYAPLNLNLSILRGHCSERSELDHNSTVEVQEGESLRLVCDARGNPPPKLSWVCGGRTWPSAQRLGAEILELYPVEQHHEGEYTCQAQHPGGFLQASLHLSVGKPPQLLGPLCSWEAPALRCGCSAQGLPIPDLRWWLGSELLPGNCSNASIQLSLSPGEPWVNSSLSLLGGFDAGLTLSCEAWNMHGAQRSSILLLPGQPSLQGVVLGAAGGAGVAGLLILCPCLLFFFVRVCKKRAPVKRGANQGDAPAPLVPASQDFLLQSLQDSTLAVGDSPGPGEEPELYYATLSFQGLRPRPAGRQDGSSTTEYSEIKTQHEHSETTKHEYSETQP